MEKPVFTIVAGANGAGKSSLYENFLQTETLYFNGDFVFAQLEKKYAGISQESIGGAVASVLERSVEAAIEKKQNFAFETNFSAQMTVNILEKFKENGYKINLVYFGINSVDIAKERVNTRTMKGGHDVSDETIEFNFSEGIKNVNEYLQVFDNALFIDNSSDLKNRNIVAEFDKNFQIKTVLNENTDWFNKNFRSNFLNLKFENQIEEKSERKRGFKR